MADLDKEADKDPFWDPPEDIFLGSAYVYLQTLAYGLDIDEYLPVSNYRGVTVGQLQVQVKLCDPPGNIKIEVEDTHQPDW